MVEFSKSCFDSPPQNKIKNLLEKIFHYNIFPSLISDHPLDLPSDYMGKFPSDPVKNVQVFQRLHRLTPLTPPPFPVWTDE